MRIISLSTIPPRFDTLEKTLLSLLNQTGQVDEIRLYVPRRYRRFPDYDGTPPAVPDGITLVRPEEDLGPATKVLYAARDFRGTNAQILFCDDDRIFPPQWAGELFAEQEARADECVALVGKDVKAAMRARRRPRAGRAGRWDLDYRLRRLRQQFRSHVLRRKDVRAMRRPIARAGYADILQGLGGVVVRPDFFDEAAFDIPEILWTVDDVWLSGMLAKKGIAIWLPAGLAKPPPTDADAIDSLYESVIEGADRREANRRCIEYMRERYGVWQ